MNNTALISIIAKANQFEDTQIEEQGEMLEPGGKYF